MVTVLGKFLRNLRMDRGELLKTMADKLNVTSSFLSAVENGKKKAPQEWLQRLTSIYSLSEEESIELQNAYGETNKCIEIDLNGFSDQRKAAAFAFARSISDFNEDDLKKITELIKKKGQ